MGPCPAFLVVGTPRSGTTLLQRLACELPGVRVPPETHFFSLFAPGLLARRTFPLDEPALRDELARFAAEETSRELALDVDAVVADLGGRCRSAVELFGAIVRALAGAATVHGEKTPTHLLWWRPLTGVLPGLRILGVVRDPRAVVSSNRRVPWGMDGAAVLAERWVADQRLLRAAAAALGPERCKVLRYEDVVADPDAARREVAAFLGAEVTTQPAGPPERPLYLPWETWKAAAAQPVGADRVDAWRSELPGQDAAVTGAVCRREMARFGYGDDVPGRADALRALARLDPGTQWRRLHFRVARRRRLAWIDAAPVGGPEPA